MSLDPFINRYQARIDQALERWLPSAQELPNRLHEAMRYAVLNGGKRVRPILVYATGEAVGVAAEQLDGPACAVELIHAYSLIHDDLPAMDDDDLRRGKPTCHKAFDEATAILAGDALQALAFYILSHDPAMIQSPATRLAMVQQLAQASGSRGMAGGQALDLAAEGKQLTLPELENIHIHKTGALIRTSVQLAAMSQSDLAAKQFDRLDHYAKCIGLAFQVQDDILDIEGETSVIGKPQGSDLARDKSTYPALMGLDGAKSFARQLHEEAMNSLAGFDQRAEPLRWLAQYIVSRAS